MLPSLDIPVLPPKAIKVVFDVPLFLLLYVTLGFSQKAQQDEGSLPKYDLHTETKTKGVVDEVKLLPLGTRKDFTELVIKSGDDKVHIYVCPKPFQEEMGHQFQQGRRDFRHGFKGQAGSVGRDPCSRTREGYGHTSILRRQRQAGMGLAHREVTAWVRGPDETLRHNWVGAEEQRRE